MINSAHASAHDRAGPSRSDRSDRTERKTIMDHHRTQPLAATAGQVQRERVLAAQGRLVPLSPAEQATVDADRRPASMLQPVTFDDEAGLEADLATIRKHNDDDEDGVVYTAASEV